jgi:hypothetical protein
MPFVCEPIEIEVSLFWARFSEADDSDLVMAVCVDERYNTEVTHCVGICNDSIFPLAMDKQIKAINRLKNFDSMNKIKSVL